MNISILSVFPELYSSFMNTSLMRRAQVKGIITVNVDAFFSFVQPKERIDAPSFGHGAGMLIKPEVVQKGIEAHEAVHGKAYKIFFSPQGKKLDQPYLAEIAKKAQQAQHVMLIPARYEGMDTRVEELYADEIISIGDYVLMGGDIPAMVLLEGMLRLVPGVVGKQESIEKESFSGPFVDHPEYTEPVIWQDMTVPEIVRSGNHGAVDAWRKEQAAAKSVKNHFSWVRSSLLTQDDRKLVARYIPPHYVALFHGEVVVTDDGQVGNSSVTSIDVHDIARSSKTFGVKHYFVVTPLEDQQKIVKKLLGFWQEGAGFDYNPQRYEALKNVTLAEKLDEVVEKIIQREGKKPLVIATSAQHSDHIRSLSYHDQGLIWAQDRPVLFIFGTAKGLSSDLINRCDYLLVPVEGFSHFNHLSVRSAVAIILDRWLGINPILRYSE